MNKLITFLAAAVMSVAVIGGHVSATHVKTGTGMSVYDMAEPMLYDQEIHVVIAEGENALDLYKFVAKATGTYELENKIIKGDYYTTGIAVLDEDYHMVMLKNGYFDFVENKTYYIWAGEQENCSACEFYFKFSHYSGDGNPYKDTWRFIDGYWHYCNEAGINVTGWAQYRGGWYYFDDKGRMMTGWQLISGKWYYLNPDNGAMFSDWQKIGGKWYYFNKSGVMQTGWQKIGNKWYFFNNSGAMVTGWQQISKKWYYFKPSGEMVTDWQSIGGKWYYFETSGAMKTGWLQQGSKWYYLKASGEMATGTVTIDGRKNVFDNNGVWKGYAA